MEMTYNLDSGLLASLPEQRARIARHQSPYFTILVAGETGCGKSTFIQSLLGHDFRMDTCPKPQSRTLSSKLTIDNSHDKSQVINSANLVLKTKEYANGNITAIETSEFGDFENNMHAWLPITNYINRQHTHYMYLNEQPKRAKRTDPRVHLCVYFVPPTGRLHELDLTSIKEISKCCNVIVCIAKADSMTRSDLLTFKHDIRNQLKDHNVELYNTGEDQPFSVVSSNEFIDLPDGRQVLGREYRWGSVDVTDPEHSDLMKLKTIILQTHTLKLVNNTNDKFYEQCREQMRITRALEGLNLHSPESLANFSEFEIRSVISEYPESKLMNRIVSSDILLERQIAEIREQFDFVRDHQLSRFDALEKKLMEKRMLLWTELDEIAKENRQIESEIEQLKLNTKRK